MLMLVQENNRAQGAGEPVLEAVSFRLPMYSREGTVLLSDEDDIQTDTCKTRTSPGVAKRYRYQQ